jgi:hypothetical protein
METALWTFEKKEDLKTEESPKYTRVSKATAQAIKEDVRERHLATLSGYKMTRIEDNKRKVKWYYDFHHDMSIFSEHRTR